MFEFTMETVKEFDLKPHEIPSNCKGPFDQEQRAEDFVEKNVMITRNLNDINRILYVSRLKHKIEKEIELSQKRETIEEQQRRKLEVKLS